MRRASMSLIPLALASCVGQVGAPVNQGDAPICSTADPGPSPIRRMTRLEYNNTVRDLLGDDTHPADGFAPEEEALGFNNNAYALGVTTLLAEELMVASEEISQRATADLGALLPCDPATASDACVEDWIAAFGKRAWRRPLGGDEVTRLLALFQQARDEWDFTTGIQLVIQAALQSPHFLYRVEFGVAQQGSEQIVELDHWEMASRLSYFIWSSMPDDELFAAAEAGQLGTATEIEAQARRMLADPRERAAVAEFHEQWLDLDRMATVTKDTTMFPDWTEVKPLLVSETHAFLDHVIWDGEGDLWTLLTAPYTMANARLADFYGVTGPTTDTFEKTDLDPARRAGLLTQASLLSINAKANQTSPVHRGKFVREQLLCQMLPAPPDDVEIVPPDLDPTLTTRERFAQHSTDPYCAGCHHLMDPIGFGFEHYDALGAWRDLENGLAIDATGEINASEDVNGTFDGIPDLAHRLAASNQVRECVARQWFRYAYGRGETSADNCTMAGLFDRFAASEYDIQELLVALTQTDAFLYKRVTEAGL